MRGANQICFENSSMLGIHLIFVWWSTLSGSRQVDRWGWWVNGWVQRIEKNQINGDNNDQNIIYNLFIILTIYCITQVNTWVNIFMNTVSDSRYERALQTTKLCKILDSLRVKSGYSEKKCWSSPSWGKTCRTVEWAPCWLWRSSVIHWASWFLCFPSFLSVHPLEM